jgi:hypothetical protein
MSRDAAGFRQKTFLLISNRRVKLRMRKRIDAGTVMIAMRMGSIRALHERQKSIRIKIFGAKDA